jgi:cellulose synthase/poly-beta-1,6-N-acetylglucosamine synthase-like glycosyltransferase
VDVLGAARIILVAAEATVGVFVLYLCVVAGAAVVATFARTGRTRRDGEGPAEAMRDFIIVIPAHDEEKTLSVLLDCLCALTYPREHYMVCVVADNCGDSTAAVARAYEGVRVYERCDDTRLGKGYALNWIFERIEAERLHYDACLILDADAVVESDILESFVPALSRGAQAVQGRYLTLNPREATSAALRWVALALANHVRPLGRYTLGSSASITGNGFCLTHALLQAHPWRAFGLTEDYQYYLSLVESGVRTHYAPDAVVLSAMPTTFRELRSQDVRWESMGAGQTPARVIAWRLLRAWLRARDLMRLEALIELLTPPLSLLCLSSALLAIAAVLMRDPLALIGAFVLMAGLSLYVSSAFLLLRAPIEAYRALLFAPWFALRKVWIIFVVSRRKRETSAWVRTSRGA